MPKGIKGFQKGHVGYKYWLGKKITEESKKKMRIAKLGKPSKLLGKKRGPLSDEHKLLLSKIAKEKGYGKWMKGKKHTVKTRKKLSKLFSGENAPGWKGGLKLKNIRIRNSLKYRLWRERVFKRDRYTCVWCGDSKGGNLNADHIKPFALFPKLRFLLANGRTLCVSCHRKTDTYAKNLLGKSNKKSHNMY